MIYTLTGLFSDNINNKLLPLIITAMQQLVLSHNVSNIMDTFLTNAPEHLADKTKSGSSLSFLRFMYDDYLSNPLAYANKEELLEDVADSRTSSNTSRIGGPTWTTIEKRDPDGYVRTFLFGVLIKGKKVDNKLFYKIMREERSNLGGMVYNYVVKFLRSFSIIKSMYLYYKTLQTLIITGSLSRSKNIYTYKKVILSDEGFVFLNELDLIDAFGEDFSEKDLSKFLKIGWKNVVIDLSSSQTVLYWGKYSGNGMIAIPYRTLITQVSDRIEIEEYLDVKDKSKQLFRMNITKAKSIKVIRKALRR